MAFLAAILATLSQPVLNRSGVADLFSGDTGNHHDFCLGELTKYLHLYLQYEQLQQLGHLGGAEADPLVARDYHHLQVLHLRVLLKKQAAQRRHAVVETQIMVHSHFTGNHRKSMAAGLSAAVAFPGPEDAVETVAQLFEFEGYKAVELIAGCCGIEAMISCRSALEDAVVPVAGVSTAEALAGCNVAAAWGWGCRP